MNRAVLAACVGLVAGAWLAAPVSARAHEVQPMIATVAPSGSNASYRVMIRNTDAMPITLEISPYRVEIKDDGSAERTVEDNDVILFPPQTIVQPGGEQAIQVRYVGPPTLDEGRIYAIVISQLPVDFAMPNSSEGSQTQVKIGFDFVSHMVVQPPSAQAQLSVGPISRTADALTFEVTNTGSGVTLLRTAEWTVTPQSGAPVTLESANVDFGQFGAILPGGKRMMKIPTAAVPGMTGEVAVTIALK